MLLIGLFIGLLMADWIRQLVRLRKHQPLIAPVWWLCWVPGISNIYLRLYFFIDQPTPGTSDSGIKKVKADEAAAGAGRVNIERPYVYY